VKYYLEVNGRERLVELRERLGELSVTVDGEPVELAYERIDEEGQLLVLSGGRSYGVSIEGDTDQIGITIAGHLYDVRIEDEREHAAHAAEREASRGGGRVTSVMPGVVVEVLVARGAEVAAGQPLLVLEAMKMQNEIAAPAAGVVQEVFVEQGSAVGAGAPLVQLGPPPESEDS